MNMSRARYAPALGTAILFAGPPLLSYPFLAAWGQAGNYGNPFSVWLYPVLLLSMVAGCTDFMMLRFRTSTKLLMLLFYIPSVAIALFAWSYSWCSLCDF
ncbi:hypothetical protein [Sphingomonas trueperi]|uniref:hypothetical protein n=1 Tax=Sphingomonas trueperi TaxID=53317 RepID=UPI000F2D8B5E